MTKIVKRLVATLLILAAVFVLTPTTVFAESEFMDPGKTYKLTVSKSIDDNLRRVAEEVKSGKSITYTLDVPKGALHVQLVSSYDFKAEIIDSKNKVVKVMKPFKYEAEEE